MNRVISRRWAGAAALGLLVALLSPAVPAKQLPVEIQHRDLEQDGRIFTYGVTVPRTPPDEAGYPLVLALHYSAGRGAAQEYFGLTFAGQLVLPALEELKAVTVVPDAPEGSWAHPQSERMVLAVIEAVRKEFPIDSRRTLVMGYSMGGAGAWYFAANHPALFRAAIPIAAMPLVTPATDARAAAAAVQAALDAPGAAWAETLKGVPVYVIHSRDDEVVPFEPLERAVETLRARGARVTLAPVDGIPHHLTSAYIEPLADAVAWIRKVWAEPSKPRGR
jgi:predicted peptidase